MYSLESPHRDDSNEYTQHTIILWKMEKTFLDYFHLPSDLALCLTPSGSNYPCLEQISMVPKMFEPLKFDCRNKNKTNARKKKVKESKKCHSNEAQSSRCTKEEEKKEQIRAKQTPHKKHLKPKTHKQRKTSTTLERSVGKLLGF